MSTPVWDAHAHFFSPRFFAAIAAQASAARGAELSATEVAGEAGLELPGSVEALADRWVAELDRAGVERSVMLASVPGDAASVLEAQKRHPGRLIPYAMFHPLADGALEALDQAAERGLKGACLFPAMAGFELDDEGTVAFARRCAERGVLLFVHCGLLRVGLRDKLGLPSPFDLRRANPLALGPLLAATAPHPVVLPHFGAGYFREALLIARQWDQVHLDSSSENSWRLTQPGRPDLCEIFQQALEIVGPRRVLFGSDSSVFPPGYRLERLEEQRGLWEEQLSAEDAGEVLGGNLRRLLGE